MAIKDEQKTFEPKPAGSRVVRRPAPRQEGTGQEPDRRGTHRPGLPPGHHVDTGPVTVPAAGPRRS